MNYQLRAKKNTSIIKQLAIAGFFVCIMALLVRLVFPGSFVVFSSFLYAQDSFLSNVQTNFTSKQDLIIQNSQLQQQIDVLQRESQFTQSTQDVYAELYKTIQVPGDSRVTTEVLSRPPFAAYDTYIINAGSQSGIEMNQVVTTGGTLVIGYIDLVTTHYSRVRLFSSAGQSQTISIDGFLFDSAGRGAGTILVRLPRTYAETSGQVARLPGLSNLNLGIISVTEFDPQDSFVTGAVIPQFNSMQVHFVTVLEQKWTDVDALDLEQFNNTETDGEDSDN